MFEWRVRSHGPFLQILTISVLLQIRDKRRKQLKSLYFESALCSVFGSCCSGGGWLSLEVAILRSTMDVEIGWMASNRTKLLRLFWRVHSRTHSQRHTGAHSLDTIRIQCASSSYLMVSLLLSSARSSLMYFVSWWSSIHSNNNIQVKKIPQFKRKFFLSPSPSPSLLRAFHHQSECYRKIEIPKKYSYIHTYEHMRAPRSVEHEYAEEGAEPSEVN